MKVNYNSNEKIVSEIKERLNENDGFCPCSLIRNDDTKCMCKEFRDQIERGEEGECHCGLYIAVQEPQADSCVPAKPNSSEGNIVGKIVKIKKDVKSFCGGNAIPDSVRNAELFISRENKNGTVMLARSDTGMNIDILPKTHVVITKKNRRQAD